MELLGARVAQAELPGAGMAQAELPGAELAHRQATLTAAAGVAKAVPGDAPASPGS